MDKDNPTEQDVVDIIKSMGQFMRNTNDILAQTKIRLNNLQIDIDKLKKKEKRIIEI